RLPPGRDRSRRREGPGLGPLGAPPQRFGLPRRERGQPPAHQASPGCGRVLPPAGRASRGLGQRRPHPRRREGGQRHRLCPGHLEAEDPLGAGRLGDGGLGGCLLGRRVGLWRVPRHMAALDAHYRGGAAGTLRRVGAVSARGDSARHPGVLARVRPPHGLRRGHVAPSPDRGRRVRGGAPDPNLLRVVTDRDAPHGDHPMHAAAESERPAATARGERSPAGSHVVRAVAGVSVYHAQVEAVVEAVEILSPTTYAWFDRESPALAPRIVRAMSTRTARDYLLYTLQRQLYADFYCQGFPIPTEEEDVPAFPQGTTSFLRSLSSANAGTGCREGNWEVRVVEEHA